MEIAASFAWPATVPRFRVFGAPPSEHESVDVPCEDLYPQFDGMEGHSAHENRHREYEAEGLFWVRGPEQNFSTGGCIN